MDAALASTFNLVMLQIGRLGGLLGEYMSTSLLSEGFMTAFLPAFAAMLFAGSAAAQPNAAKLPTQVQRELMSIVKDCRDAGGKPGTSPGLLVVTDLTGDGIADFVIHQGALNCQGSASLFSGAGGSQLIIYAGARQGQAIKVFEHGVMEVKVDKGASATVKVAVGGDLCGQRVTKNTDMSMRKTCWRPLVWSATKKRMEFAPVSRIEPMN